MVRFMATALFVPAIAAQGATLNPFAEHHALLANRRRILLRTRLYPSEQGCNGLDEAPIILCDASACQNAKNRVAGFQQNASIQIKRVVKQPKAEAPCLCSLMKNSPNPR
jgi:hypothetical protein